MGKMDAATIEGIGALLKELDRADEEQFDVAVTDESGWCLSLSQGGRLIWENVEEDEEPRHLMGINREDAAAYFRAIIEADLATLEALAWLPGYG